MIKLGIVVNVASKPLTVPQHAPKASVIITAASVGTPDSIIETHTQPLKASTLPTDKSIHPMINTMPIPNASTASTLIGLMTDSKLSAVKKVSVNTDSASTIRNKAASIIKLRFKNFCRLFAILLLTVSFMFISSCRIMHDLLLRNLLLVWLKEFDQPAFAHHANSGTHIHNLRQL